MSSQLEDDFRWFRSPRPLLDDADHSQPSGGVRLPDYGKDLTFSGRLQSLGTRFTTEEPENVAVNRETAERCTILRGLVGSTVHGLNVNDGIEDRDEMGICVEPLEDAMALWAPFEQFIYRTAAEREGRENARSTAGDLDLTIYSLRKWARLALKGNPTIMLLLFTPEDQLVYCDNLGAELRALMPAIVSRRGMGARCVPPVGCVNFPL